MNSTPRPVVLSGIQPSGRLTIGNYLGAIKNWLPLHEQYDCYYMLVDLHAITVRQDPKVLRERCYEFLALYIACGLDPAKNVLFVQSHVSAHARLSWILNCYTQMGELNRMTQFKDKAAKQLNIQAHENLNIQPDYGTGDLAIKVPLKNVSELTGVNVGLFDYPVLMAADILLYDSAQVPVGDDQKQHLELTRDIASRFNNMYGPVFKVPEPMIPPVGARIMGLQEPRAKMSKSDDSETNSIYLLDSPDVITRKIKRAVTDMDNCIRYAPLEQPGVANLLSILSATTGESMPTLESRFSGQGYGSLKSAVAEAVVETLRPIQERYDQIRLDTHYLNLVLEIGRRKAQSKSRKVLKKVHDVLGFIPETSPEFKKKKGLEEAYFSQRSELAMTVNQIQQKFGFKEFKLSRPKRP